MSENCKDCVQIQNIKEDVTNLRNDIRDIYKRVGYVENTLGRKEEQIETIFNLLKDIKDSIKGINEKLGNLEKKPAEDYSKIKLIIITALTSSIVGAVIGFISVKFK